MKNILFLFFLIPLTSFSQENNSVNSREQRIADSKQQIQELHESVLLVRLSTKKTSINALRKVGRKELAQKIEEKQKTRNQEIINSFRAHFDFCPVYFFYSDYSKYIINNQLDSVLFLNDKLEITPSIKVSNSIYFTAEFTSLEQDTAQYHNSTYYDRGEKKESYYGGSENSLTGLIIKNKNLYQLKHPFPYYVREYKGLFFQRAIPKVIIKMNQNLHNYYNSDS